MGGILFLPPTTIAAGNGHFPSWWPGGQEMCGDSWVSPGTGDAGELGKMRWISGAVYRYNLKCGQGFGIGFSLSIFFSFPYPQKKLRFIHVQLAVKSVWCHAGSDTQR